MEVLAVVTMGLEYAAEYVTHYKIHASYNGSNWHLIAPSDNTDIWTGNTDDSTQIQNVFPEAVVGRFFRLTIVDYNTSNRPALNWDLLGCNTSGYYCSEVFLFQKFCTFQP